MCLSVTGWYPIHTNEGRIMRSSLWGSKSTLVFWYQQCVGATSPSTLNLWPTPSEKRRLRPISAYNVSTVRASEKVQISRISRPRAFRWAIDEVRTLPLSPSKGGSKSNCVIFVNKIQVRSNKVCYKVSLCENLQRKSCIRTIPPSNGVDTLWVK